MIDQVFVIFINQFLIILLSHIILRLNCLKTSWIRKLWWDNCCTSSTFNSSLASRLLKTLCCSNLSLIWVILYLILAIIILKPRIRHLLYLWMIYWCQRVLTFPSPCCWSSTSQRAMCSKSKRWSWDILNIWSITLTIAPFCIQLNTVPTSLWFLLLKRIRHKKLNL